MSFHYKLEVDFIEDKMRENWSRMKANKYEI